MLGYKKEFFFGIYEKSDWIVSETYKRCKEFQNIDKFKDELISTVSNSTTEQKILLLRSHPQLTGKISIKNLTRESFNEQNSAGLQNCSQEEFEELHSLNASYNEKFKFPFIIAVTGLNVTKILEQFRIRVSNNYLKELEEAIFQVHKIAEIRIHQKINLMEKNV